MKTFYCKQELDTLFKKNIKTINQTEIVPISNESKNTINLIKKIIYKKLYKNYIKIVFRGDNKVRISKKIFGNIDVENDYKIYSHLYYFGAKSDDFFKVNDKGNFFDQILEQYNKESANFIFNQFHVISNKKDITEDQKKQIIKLRYKNKNFFSFFSDKKNNYKFFRNEICSLDLPERKKIFDYYFYLLHILGKRGISNFLGFVSTSYCYNTASSFALNNDNHTKGPIIFIYSINNPIWCHGICSESICYFSKHQKYRKLPQVKEIFFKNEKELAVKRALFPHRLIGIEDIANNFILLNPHLISNEEKIIKDQIENGILLNHTNWNNEIKKYNYRKYTSKYKDIFTNIKI